MVRVQKMKVDQAQMTLGVSGAETVTRMLAQKVVGVVPVAPVHLHQSHQRVARVVGVVRQTPHLRKRRTRKEKGTKIYHQ